MPGELSRIMRIGVERVALWFSRAHERRALSEFDAHMLRDIGLTRSAARMEPERPFWHGNDRDETSGQGSAPRNCHGTTSHSWI